MKESKYRKKIESLVRDLAEYDHFSVVEAFLSTLIVKAHSRHDAFMRMPWIQFFLLKLALLGSSGKKIITSKKFVEFANQLYSAQGDAVGLSSHQLELQLRPMILQQAWYQLPDDFTLYTLFRQNFLFSSGNRWYSDSFKAIAGLELKNFFMITVYLNLKSRNNVFTALGINIFELIHKLVPAIAFSEIKNYFKLLGIRVADLPDYVSSHRLSGIFPSEYFQDTPLKDKPLLINGKQILMPDISMFNAAMRDFVPDFLKKIPSYKDHFGRDCEAYIGSLLIESGLVFWIESEIELYYKRNGLAGKVVDFLIRGDHRVVLVESKAIEPGPVVKTASDPELLRKLLDKSFIRAIKQGVHSAFELSKRNDFSGLKFSLLIVTHADFGIYGGRWVEQFIDRGLADWIELSYPGVALSLDDVIYCTLNDFENLLQAHKAGVRDFYELVEQASTKGLAPAKRKMTFQQYVFENVRGSIGCPQALKVIMDDYLEEVNGVFKANVAYWGQDYRKLIHTAGQLIDYINQPERANA